MTASITRVSVRTAPFSTATWLDEQRVSSPMAWFPGYAERRSAWLGPGADLVWICIETDEPEVLFRKVRDSGFEIGGFTWAPASPRRRAPSAPRASR